MFTYDPTKILCDIKFVPVRSMYATEDRGWISVDGKTYFREVQDRHMPNVPFTADPQDHLNKLFQMWEAGLVLHPNMETCGGHFGRFLARAYSKGSSWQTDLPDYLKGAAGGFVFQGNHVGLSYGFSIMTSDLALSRKILTAFATIYSSETYQDAAFSSREKWDVMDVYYSKTVGFCGFEYEYKKDLARRIHEGGRASKYDPFLNYVMTETTYLGLRKDLNLGEILRAKLDDPNEYFNQILPWDYQLQQD